MNLLRGGGDVNPRIKSVGELRIMDVGTGCTLRRVTMWPHSMSWVLYGTYCVVMRPDDWMLFAWNSHGVRHSFFDGQSCEYRPNVLLPGGGGLAILINDGPGRHDDEDVFKSFHSPVRPATCSRHPVLLRTLWLNPISGVRGRGCQRWLVSRERGPRLGVSLPPVHKSKPTSRLTTQRLFGNVRGLRSAIMSSFFVFCWLFSSSSLSSLFTYVKGCTV